MIRSAVTVCVVEQARQGPFVYHGDVAAAAAEAKSLGFDAIELFAPGPDAVDASELSRIIADNGLALAAVGTGAGALVHQLTLSDPDAAARSRAVDFVKSMIDYGAPFGAPAIIGSMQGRFGGDVSRDAALTLLGESLSELAAHAKSAGVPLLYEFLNRYETNLLVTTADAVQFLESRQIENVQILADLFHMNIEEVDLAAAIRSGGSMIGHVHLADSNRSAAGFGHTDFAPVAKALEDIEFDGFASAEVFPKPDSSTAAQQTISTFRELFPR